MIDADPDIAEHWVTVNGLRMYARSSAATPRAETPPVVLVHGYQVSSRLYVPLLQSLAPHCRAYAPDLPGFGQSEHPDHILDIAGLADATVSWLDAMRLEHPVLAGHSLGGQIVAEIHHRHPGRIVRAVLVSPTGDPGARNALVQCWRMFRDALREPPRFVALAMRDYLRAGPRRALAMPSMMNAHPMVARLEGLTIPTLLVVGTNDPVAPRDWACVIVEHLPNGRVALIPHGTHGVQFSAPGALSDAIRSFITEEFDQHASAPAAPPP